MCPAVSPVVIGISQYPPTIVDDHLNISEMLVVTIYDKESNTRKVNEARQHMFVRKQRSYDSILQTSAFLAQHVKRSAFKAVCMGGQETECNLGAQPVRVGKII